MDDIQQSNAALKHAAEEWRITFDSIADPISIHDNEFRITRLNKAFAQAHGGDEVSSYLGRHCYEVVHGMTQPPPECPHQKVREEKTPVTHDYYDDLRNRHLEISMAPVLNDSNEMVGIVQIMKDITDRKKMEESLITTDRMVSLGEMASGLAHEVNNPLTGVIGFTQLLLSDKRLPEELKRDLELVDSEARRAADIVRKLLNLARQGASAHCQVDINATMETVLQMRAYELRMKNITVEKHLDGTIPKVQADILELQQVFINLIINAEYFMYQCNGEGRLRVTTENRPGGVRIVIEDNGPGIPQARLPQIFSPFFTTKDVGQGTGLGLSICRGIVNRSGGKIWAESDEGSGAKFIIELPSCVGQTG